MECSSSGSLQNLYYENIGRTTACYPVKSGINDFVMKNKNNLNRFPPPLSKFPKPALRNQFNDYLFIQREEDDYYLNQSSWTVNSAYQQQHEFYRIPTLIKNDACLAVRPTRPRPHCASNNCVRTLRSRSCNNQFSSSYGDLSTKQSLCAFRPSSQYLYNFQVYNSNITDLNTNRENSINKKSTNNETARYFLINAINSHSGSAN